jgi:hypothetical protein
LYVCMQLLTAFLIFSLREPLEPRAVQDQHDRLFHQCKKAVKKWRFYQGSNGGTGGTEAVRQLAHGEKGVFVGVKQSADFPENMEGYYNVLTAGHLLRVHAKSASEIPDRVCALMNWRSADVRVVALDPSDCANFVALHCTSPGVCCAATQDLFQPPLFNFLPRGAECLGGLAGPRYRNSFSVSFETGWIKCVHISGDKLDGLVACVDGGMALDTKRLDPHMLYISVQRRGSTLRVDPCGATLHKVLVVCEWGEPRHSKRVTNLINVQVRAGTVGVPREYVDQGKVKLLFDQPQIRLGDEQAPPKSAEARRMALEADEKLKQLPESAGAAFHCLLCVLPYRLAYLHMSLPEFLLSHSVIPNLRPMTVDRLAEEFCAWNALQDKGTLACIEGSRNIYGHDAEVESFHYMRGAVKCPQCGGAAVTERMVKRRCIDEALDVVLECGDCKGMFRRVNNGFVKEQ